MEISSLAATVSAGVLGQVQQEASVAVLKKALSIEQQNAQQLLQAIPPPVTPPEPGTPGALVDTWA